MRFVFILLAILSDILMAQPPSIQWSKCYGGSDDDEGFSIVKAPSGGYYLAGYAASHNGDVGNNTGNYAHLWIIRIDDLGNVIWEKTYGGTWGDEAAYKIRLTSDGGLIMIGDASSVDGDVTGLHSGSPTSGPSDAWVVKVDGSGNLQWQKCLGGNQDDTGNDIIQTYDGGYLVGATISSWDGDISLYHGGSSDCWLAKLDSIGSLIWEKSFGGSNGENINSVFENDSDKYCILGGTNSSDHDVTFNHGGTDVWMLMIDSSHSILQQKTFGGSSSDEGFSFIRSRTNKYILSCGSQSNDGDVQLQHGASDYWQVTTDGDTIFSQHSFGGSDYESPFSSIGTIDHGSLICGYSYSSDGQASCIPQFYNNFWIVKTDSSGNYEWSKCMGGLDEEVARDGIETPDGGYIIVGYTKSNDGDVSGNHGGKDVWVVKLSPPGVNVPELEAGVSDFTAYENSGGTLQLEFNAELASELNLSLFDLTGCCVLKENFDCIAGMNTHRTPSFSPAPGIYVLTLSDAKGGMVKKVFVNGGK
jgi:hypothetical protein